MKTTLVSGNCYVVTRFGIRNNVCVLVQQASFQNIHRSIYSKKKLMADAREKRAHDAKSVTAKSSTKAEQEEKCCSRERQERGNWEGADGNTGIHGWLKKGGAAEEKAFQEGRKKYKTYERKSR